MRGWSGGAPGLRAPGRHAPARAPARTRPPRMAAALRVVLALALAHWVLGGVMLVAATTTPPLATTAPTTTAPNTTTTTGGMALPPSSTSTQPSTQPSSTDGDDGALPVPVVVLAVAGAGVGLALLVLCLVVVVCRRRRRRERGKPQQIEVMELDVGLDGATSLPRPKMLMEQWIPAHMDGYQPPPNRLEALSEAVISDAYLKIPQRRIKVMESIGSGSFAEVKRAFYTEFEGQDPPTQVAIKLLDKGATDAQAVKLLQEAVIRVQFRHPHVLDLRGITTLGAQPCLVSEFVARGPLDRYLRRARPEPATMLSFSRDIASGLNYLAACSFVLGDIAARHVLVAADHSCRISGFGLSREMSDPQNPVHSLDIPWAAPELLPAQAGVATQKSNDSGLGFAAAKGDLELHGLGFPAESDVDISIAPEPGSPESRPGPCYTTQSDVWSYGVVLYEIFSHGELPFAKLTHDKIVSEVRRGFRMPPPSNCPREVYRAMIKCWHPEPAKRPSFSEVLIIFGSKDDSFEITQPTRFPDLQCAYLDANAPTSAATEDCAATPDSPLIPRALLNVNQSPRSSASWMDSTRSTAPPNDEEAARRPRRDTARLMPSVGALTKDQLEQHAAGDTPAFLSIFLPEPDVDDQAAGAADATPPEAQAASASAGALFPIAREEEAAYITIVPRDGVQQASTLPRLRQTGHRRDRQRPQSLTVSESDYMTLADAVAASRLLKNADAEFETQRSDPASSGLSRLAASLADTAGRPGGAEQSPAIAVALARPRPHGKHAIRRHASDPIKRLRGVLDALEVEDQLSEAERAPPGTELPVKKREEQEQAEQRREQKRRSQRPAQKPRRWFRLLPSRSEGAEVLSLGPSSQASPRHSIASIGTTQEDA